MVGSSSVGREKREKWKEKVVEECLGVVMLRWLCLIINLLQTCYGDLHTVPLSSIVSCLRP